MIGRLTIAYLALLAGVALLAALIVVVRAVRTARTRRREALAAGPRRSLLGYIADGGAEGAEELAALSPAAWQAVEHHALAMLSKIKGEGRVALVRLFEQRGAAETALRELGARSRVRRARAAEMLGDLGRRDAVPRLIDLLADPHPEIRLVAVRALGRIGDDAAVVPLLAMLAGRFGAPSHLVTHALIQIGPAAETALVAALVDPVPLVRVTALDALGQLAAPGAARAIAQVLATDPALEVRVAAAGTLGRVGGRAALEPLVAAVCADQPATLREAAARALGELGAEAAVPALGELLTDQRHRVAHEAAHALRRLHEAGLAELRRAAARPDHAGGHAREALAMAAVGVGEAPEAEPATQTLAVAA